MVTVFGRSSEQNSPRIGVVQRGHYGCFTLDSGTSCGDAQNYLCGAGPQRRSGAARSNPRVGSRPPLSSVTGGAAGWNDPGTAGYHPARIFRVREIARYPSAISFNRVPGDPNGRCPCQYCTKIRHRRKRGRHTSIISWRHRRLGLFIVNQHRHLTKRRYANRYRRSYAT